MNFSDLPNPLVLLRDILKYPSPGAPYASSGRLYRQPTTGGTIKSIGQCIKLYTYIFLFNYLKRSVSYLLFLVDCSPPPNHSLEAIMDGIADRGLTPPPENQNNRKKRPLHSTPNSQAGVYKPSSTKYSRRHLPFSSNK